MKQIIFLISALLLLQLVTSRIVEEELEAEERKDLEKKRIPSRWVKPAAKYVYKWGKEALKQGVAQEAFNYAKNKAKQAYNWGRDKVRKWGRKRYIDELDDAELEEFFESQLQ